MLPPSLKSSAPRPNSTRSPKKAAPKAGQELFGSHQGSARNGRTRAQQRRPSCPASPPASTASTAKIGGLHTVRPDHRRRPSRHGQDRRWAPTSPSPPRSASCATPRTGSSRTNRRGAPRAPSSASKCRPTSWRRASLPSNRESHRKTCAWARSASRSSASSRAPPPSCRACRSTSTIRPGLTIAALRTRARRLKRQKGIGLIVVDYLQLLQGTGRNGNENRVQEISEISRGLKQLAKELNVPVIGLSQLQPRGRAARGQAPATVRPARIRLDRAGRRHRPLHLSRGLLSCRQAAAPTTIPISPSGRRRWSAPTAAPK